MSVVVPQERTKRDKHLSEELKVSLKTFSGTAQEWLLRQLQESTKVDIVNEYLQAIIDLRLPTSYLTYTPLSAKRIVQNPHTDNVFYRPPGTIPGGLFRADYQDPLGTRLANNPILGR